MEISSLLTGINLTLAGAIFGIVQALKATKLSEKQSVVVERLMPSIPLVLGAIGGAIGVVDVNPVTMANKIVAGVMVGGSVAVVFKVGKTTVMGKGLKKTAAKTPSEK